MAVDSAFLQARVHKTKETTAGGAPLADAVPGESDPLTHGLLATQPCTPVPRCVLSGMGFMCLTAVGNEQSTPFATT